MSSAKSKKNIQQSKRTKKSSRKKLNLMGSVIILGDLEEASKEIAKEFEKSIERSAAKLQPHIVTINSIQTG